MAVNTPNSYTRDLPSLEVQITASLQAVSANLDAADIGDWVDISGFLKSQSRTTREKSHAEEYTTATANPIVVVSNFVSPQVHTFTMYDTDGATEDLGLTNNINPYEDIIKPSITNGLLLPFRYTNKGNSSGNKLYTHAAANTPTPISLSEPEGEGGSINLATRVFMMKTSGAAAESSVA